MNILLSFEPSEINRLEKSDVAINLINDSTFSLAFTVLVQEDSNGKLQCVEILEPNTSFVLAVERMDVLQKWRNITFQALIFGESKEDIPPAPLSIECKLDISQLQKVSSYRNPLYSEGAAYEIYFVKEGIAQDFRETYAEKLHKALTGDPDRALKEKLAADIGRRDKGTRGRELSPYKVLPPIEVDLHIGELVDTTAGMDNTSMLMLQLDTVRRTMREHRLRIGQEIIFIHGKGDGVLRKALIDLLHREYPHVEHQDASFRKYGFGATQITVKSPRK